MTVRDLANWLLDLQLWQAFLLVLVLVFLGSFGAAMGDDVYNAIFRKTAR